jgi:outer membrane protein assembly factor BamE
MPIARLLPVLLIALGTAGCGILYKQPIYQGNLIEQSAVEQLQAGMDKQQVVTLLGTPSIADPFHHQRWDYAATQRIDRRGRTEIKNLTLWFENDTLVRWDGDYFAEQDKELSERMRRFGNLPKEKGSQRR